MGALCTHDYGPESVREETLLGNNKYTGMNFGFDGGLEFRIASRVDGYVTSVKKNINAENNNFAYAA